MALVVSLLMTILPAAAVTPLAAADLHAFSSRADAWTAARAERRFDDRARALALAAEGRTAARDALAAATTTSAAPTTTTTSAPSTTTAPTTTAAPTTTTAAPTTTTTTTTAAPTTTTTSAPATTTTGTTDGPGPADPGPTTTTTAAPTTTTTAAPATTAPPGTPSAAQWAALRACESSGNYGAVSPNGRYRGAYQFSRATWDWIAAMHHPDLVGIDPAAAAPADQDAMALSLWLRRGWTPWPVCGPKAAAA